MMLGKMLELTRGPVLYVTPLVVLVLMNALSMRWRSGSPALAASPLLENALVFFVLNRTPSLMLSLFALPKCVVVWSWRRVLLLCLMSSGLRLVPVSVSV